MFYINKYIFLAIFTGGTSGGVSYVRGGGPRRGGQGRGGRGGPGNSFPRTGTNNRGGVAPFNMPRGASGNYPNSRGNSRGGGKEREWLSLINPPLWWQKPKSYYC